MSQQELYKHICLVVIAIVVIVLASNCLRKCQSEHFDDVLLSNIDIFGQDIDAMAFAQGLMPNEKGELTDAQIAQLAAMAPQPVLNVAPIVSSLDESGFVTAPQVQMPSNLGSAIATAGPDSMNLGTFMAPQFVGLPASVSSQPAPSAPSKVSKGRYCPDGAYEIPNLDPDFVEYCKAYCIQNNTLMPELCGCACAQGAAFMNVD